MSPNRTLEPRQRCLQFVGSIVSCMVSTILRFIKAERTYKLALASNISALATMTPHFFSLDRPVTMQDGYQFTLLVYEATGVTTLKSVSRICCRKSLH